MSTENVTNYDVNKPMRYVGKRETFAYILNDIAASLNINDYKERFIYDVVKIDFSYLAIQNVIATVWDTINDTFIGVMVDKTRTRWGKFKPYVLFGEIPLTLIGLFMWLLLQHTFLNGFFILL